MSEITPFIIGDERRSDGEASPVRSPYDQNVVGEVPRATEAHIDEAVACATATLAAGSLPAHRRARVLDRAADAIEAAADELASLITAESAKPIATARTEVLRAVETTRFSAAVARTLGGELIPLDASSAGEGKLGFVKRVPVGVVGAISPFNFPLNLVCHKVMPAIAAGCPVVLKPASATPLTALRLAELVLGEAGLPPGWLNVVTAPGSAANRLVEHPDVAMITFTGSPAVGWAIRAKAPRKRVSLELGNNSPVIIESDADWAAAAAKIGAAGYSFAGQSCISTQRVYVHESVHDDFVAELVGRVSALVVGDPRDEATFVSALIDPSETERVRSWIEEAADSGATLHCGGGLDERGVLAPAVLSRVEPDMRICREELFGPAVAVAAYTELEDALALANDTDFGLQAAIFTRDIVKAMQAVETLDFGGVLVNEVPTWRADNMPYGGERDSGNTREGPAYTAREMTRERLVVIAT